MDAWQSYSSIDYRSTFRRMTSNDRGFKRNFPLPIRNGVRFSFKKQLNKRPLMNSEKNAREIFNKKMKTGKRYFDETITRTIPNSPSTTKPQDHNKNATKRLGLKRKSSPVLTSDFISLDPGGPSQKQKKFDLNNNGWKNMDVFGISSSEDESSEDFPSSPCKEANFGSIAYTLTEAEQLFMSDHVSSQIHDFFLRNRQKEGFLRKKQQLRAALEKAINRTMGQGSFLVLVGSSVNGFGRVTSDADFCLVIDKDLEKIGKRSRVMKTLYSLQELLKRAPFTQNMQVIPAKVPILKFVDSYSGMECDININNLTGIRNTELMRRYAMLDPRVQPLTLVIKEWAHQRKINDASKGTLSSYSLVLMVIHFLQCGVRPSVLPSLQTKHPELFRLSTPIQNVEGVAGGVRSYRSQNKQTLFQLLENFFRYYVEDFDFDRVISVRLGKALNVSEVGSPFGKEWMKPIKIEEPFDRSNTARAVHNSDNGERVFKQFRNAYWALRRKRTLQTILPNFHPNKIDGGAIVISDD